MRLKTKMLFNYQFDACKIKQAKFFCRIIIDKNIEITVYAMVITSATICRTAMPSGT